jgi:sulfatase maturation enzyme AslB (radical SAM superfamily)
MTALHVNQIPKFQDPLITADGNVRAHVKLRKLNTVWFNTGTTCNLTCKTCYIESSPKNDRLSYITSKEVEPYLKEIIDNNFGTTEIGFTGGEPFMNPYFLNILLRCLELGFNILILTNAMKPMMKVQEELTKIIKRFPHQITMRVSLDHYTQRGHELERGRGTWETTIQNLSWLALQGIHLHIAGRTFINESIEDVRNGYAVLFIELSLNIDAQNPTELVLFPELDGSIDVPEITTGCWDTLNLNPNDIMCASSRMIVKRKNEATPKVVACTLLPYDTAFELGANLRTAKVKVPLNHAHCAKFCVLGGASCS